MRKDILLVIPAYNEEMNIENTLNELLDDGINELMDILVINDGSTDDTLRRVKKYGPEVKVIDQIYNMGYGAALQTGYKYAVQNDYSYLLQMDADGQHDHSSLFTILSRLMGETPPLGLEPGKKAASNVKAVPDIVIGSRFLEGSKSFEISRGKKIAISFFKSIIKGYTGYRLTDPTSGLQGLNREAFSYYAGFTNFDIQYPDLNMIVQMIFLGFHVEEVPAVMRERSAGVSMHSGFWHQIKYMAVMTVSTFNAFTRHYEVFAGKKGKAENK